MYPGVAKTDDSAMIECDSKSQADNSSESLLTLLDNDISTCNKVGEREGGQVEPKFDQTTEQRTGENELENGRSTSEKCETDDTDTVTSADDAPTTCEKQADDQIERSNASGEEVENRSNSSNVETSNDKSESVDENDA